MIVFELYNAPLFIVCSLMKTNFKYISTISYNIISKRRVLLPDFPLILMLL
jgi:hypothetical protein